MDLNPKHNVEHLKVEYHDGSANHQKIKIADITNIGFPDDCKSDSSKIKHKRQSRFRLFTNDQGGLELIDTRSKKICNSNDFCFENWNPEVSSKVIIFVYLVF